MFGFFGKGAMVPAPVALVDQAQPMPTEMPLLPEEPELEPLPPEPLLTETDIIQEQIAKLRAAVEAKKASKEAQIKAVQDTQKKQAAYGRDVLQLRPEKSGYATESEKIMGGQTGYSKSLGSVSDEELTSVATDVHQATLLVQQLTKDVKAGVASKSELKRALQALQEKSDQAKQLASELSGFDLSNWKHKLIVLIMSATVIYLVFRHFR